MQSTALPDYYAVLGLTPEATSDDIKKSFRSLAMKHHPDKNGNSEESRQTFMKIVEAYEVLSDENARKKYDSKSNRSCEQPASTAWVPPADFNRVYSYDHIKRHRVDSSVKGGMWDISDEANSGMWKATMLLFACLGAIVLYIILVH
jgi:curved DNA-binding protein CbpA